MSETLSVRRCTIERNRSHEGVYLAKRVYSCRSPAMFNLCKICTSSLRQSLSMYSHGDYHVYCLVENSGIPNFSVGGDSESKPPANPESDRTNHSQWSR